MRGVKENLKPCVYKLWKHEKCDRVLFVERSGELRGLARLSAIGTEPKRKQALRGPQSGDADPKPGDLPMSRMKLP